MKKFIFSLLVVLFPFIISSCSTSFDVEKVPGDHFTNSEGVLKFLDLADDKEIVQIIYHDFDKNILFVHVVENSKNYIYVSEGPNDNVRVVKISGFSLSENKSGKFSLAYKFNLRVSETVESASYFELLVRGTDVVVKNGTGRDVAEYTFPIK